MAGSYGGRISLQLPAAKLIIVKSSTTHPKSDNEEFVNLHNFNYAVEVTLSDVFTTDSLQSAETMKFSDCAPEKLKLPIKSIEADGSYFQLPNTSLETWLSADVRTLFSRGKLYGACKNGRIDSDECVPCVLPSGLLLLSVDKTSYEQLGLDGKVSTFYGRDSRNKENRRLIRINLTDPAFSPGSKLFERVARCFKQRGSSWTHDYSVCWQPLDPKDTDIITTVFSGATKIKLASEVYQSINKRLPCMDSLTDVSVAAERWLETYEWLGAMSCHLNLSNSSADSYSSTLACPEPSREANGVIVAGRWTGMIAPRAVHNIIEAASHAVTQTARADAWIAVSVWGFDDTPVSWGVKEHGHCVGGENNYTVLLLPEGNYVRFASVDPHDMYT